MLDRTGLAPNWSLLGHAGPASWVEGSVVGYGRERPRETPAACCGQLGPDGFGVAHGRSRPRRSTPPGTRRLPGRRIGQARLGDVGWAGASSTRSAAFQPASTSEAGPRLVAAVGAEPVGAQRPEDRGLVVVLGRGRPRVGVVEHAMTVLGGDGVQAVGVSLPLPLPLPLPLSRWARALPLPRGRMAVAVAAVVTVAGNLGPLHRSHRLGPSGLGQRDQPGHLLVLVLVLVVVWSTSAAGASSDSSLSSLSSSWWARRTRRSRPAPASVDLVDLVGLGHRLVRVVLVGVVLVGVHLVGVIVRLELVRVVRVVLVGLLDAADRTQGDGDPVIVVIVRPAVVGRWMVCTWATSPSSSSSVSSGSSVPSASSRPPTSSRRTRRRPGSARCLPGARESGTALRQAVGVDGCRDAVGFGDLDIVVVVGVGVVGLVVCEGRIGGLVLDDGLGRTRARSPERHHRWSRPRCGRGRT